MSSPGSAYLYDVVRSPRGKARVDGGLAQLKPQDIEVAHIGNFAAELFCNQSHLGGLFAACEPEFAGLPASRHEGACACGSLAMLAAGPARGHGLHRS